MNSGSGGGPHGGGSSGGGPPGGVGSSGPQGPQHLPHWSGPLPPAAAATDSPLQAGQQRQPNSLDGPGGPSSPLQGLKSLSVTLKHFYRLTFVAG